MSVYYTIRIKQNHSAALTRPGDFEGEFVRNVSGDLLCWNDSDDKEIDEKTEPVGKIGALLIRCGEAMNQRVSILDQADAHSGSAESVTSSVFGRYHNRISGYAEQCVHDVLYLEEIEFSEDRTRSDLDLWFILRFCQQFDVDLVVIDASYKRATKLGFRGMIGRSKEYLMLSTAFAWKEDVLPPIEAPYGETVQ